jgi:hypothetical protein
MDQDGLIILVRKLTEEASHAPECYITPDDTHCECVVGKIRDALPRCNYSVTVHGSPTVYQCLSISHPDQPWKHFMTGDKDVQAVNS